jgi:hypothetical protein
MARSNKRLVSFEAFVGVAVGLLVGLLPMTPLPYFLLSLVFLGIVGHLSWHFAGVRGVSKINRKATVSAGVVAVFTCVLAWGAYARFGSANHPAISTTTVTGNNNIITGPVSGGQVGNNNTINNFYASPPALDSSFSEDAGAHPIVSIGCMNIAPIGELLSGIKSGNPTPFLSYNRIGAPPQSLVSPYLKDGILTADIVLLAPKRLYNAFSLRDGKFNLLAPDWDLNASGRAIEIVNEHGTPIFQLIRTSKSHLQIDGLFRTSNAVWLLGRNGTTIGAMKGEEATRYTPPPDFLPKMFLYPSWQHPGEMVNPQPSRPKCPDDSKGILAISRGLTLP